MKKQYFSHDSNARNDEKLIRLRMRHKWEGYGIFWAIIEKLRDSSDYMCVVDYDIIAYDLRADTATIKSIVEDFGLFAFTEDRKCFYSESLMKRMAVMDKTSELQRERVKKRWEKQKAGDENSEEKTYRGNTTVEPRNNGGNTDVIPNHTNKNKRKETNKESNTNVLPKKAASIDAPIKQREISFYESLKPYLGDYGKEMLREFYDYWSESNKSKTKMRFESEKTWDLDRRLKRWSNNSFEKNGKSSKNNGTRSLDNKESILRECEQAISGDDTDRKRKIII